MNRNFRNKLLVAVVLATTAPLAMTGTAFAQHQDKDQRAQKQQEREKAKGARQDAAASRQEARQQEAAASQQQRQAAMSQDRGERQQHMQQAQQAREQQVVAEQRARERDAAANRAERQAAQVGNQAARQDNRAERQMAQRDNQAARQDDRAQRQQAQVANQAARQDDRAARQQARLSRAQQDQIINTQKARVNSYRTWTTSQRSAGQQYAQAIQRQNRSAQYAYIQDYNNRYWSQQQRYMGMSLDYYNDPYFYSAPSYRYMRDGSWYTINQYGANILQQAINDGYGEGYRSGRADRMDGWRFDYRSSYVYQNAAYGFNGYYGDRNEYTYYFRQGFRRGYEDGYYSRYQYGVYRNGNYSIVGAVLNTILGLQPYGYRY